LLPKYADYLLRTPTYAAEYLRRSTGVNSSRLRLYPEEFLKVEVIIPPRSEQAAIIRFLDHATANSDRFIRAKKRQALAISLLSQK